MTPGRCNEAKQFVFKREGRRQPVKVLERERDPITIFHSHFSSLACNTPAPRPVETITTPTVHPKPFLSTLFFPSTDFVPLISQGWARSRLSPGRHSLPASTVPGSGQVVKYRQNDSIWDRHSLVSIPRVPTSLPRESPSPLGGAHGRQARGGMGQAHSTAQVPAPRGTGAPAQAPDPAGSRV